MSAGAVVDRVAKDVGRTHGALVTMVVKRKIERTALREIAATLDAAARAIRAEILKEET